MKELLVLGFLVTYPAKSNIAEEQTAYNYAAQAFYKTSGLEQNVDRLVQDRIKNIPEEIKTIIGNTYLIVKTINEKRIQVSFEFP